jgi:AcrR family transcriptional regulator
VPKRVDRDARRREIADALLRLAAAEGLESVSLRHVAAEAGISMGAVQHYFRSKDEMIVFALEHQSRQQEQRITAKLRGAARPPTARDVVRTIMVEILPTDGPSRAAWLAGIAYFIRAMSDPRLTAIVAAGGPKVVAALAERLEVARNAGELDPGVEPAHEAVVLWSLIDAQATAIVLGGRTPEQAVATVDYHLSRIFRG